MRVIFEGMCSGTETRKSNKTGKPYQITKFVDVETLDTVEVFGDLGLVAHRDVRKYEIRGKITGFEFPEVYVDGKHVERRNQPVQSAELPDVDTVIPPVAGEKPKK